MCSRPNRIFARQNAWSPRASPRRRYPTLGFSLLEMMVVLALLGMIATIVTVNVRGQLARGKHRTAITQVAAINQAVENYYIDNKNYPTADEGLDALLGDGGTGYLSTKRLPLDPWGNAYQYNIPGRDGEPYEVVSFGADGSEGGDGVDADIFSWDLHGSDGT